MSAYAVSEESKKQGILDSLNNIRKEISYGLNDFSLEEFIKHPDFPVPDADNINKRMIDIFKILNLQNKTLHDKIDQLEKKEELRYKVYANSKNQNLQAVKKAFDEELSKLNEG